MDYFDVLGWVLAALLAAYAIYAVITGKGKGAESDVLGALYRRQELVRQAVAAAEQLWSTGQIPETKEGVKDTRFLWAANRIREFYPDLTDGQLEMLIEAAVFWAKKGVKELETE